MYGEIGATARSRAYIRWNRMRDKKNLKARTGEEKGRHLRPQFLQNLESTSVEKEMRKKTGLQ